MSFNIMVPSGFNKTFEFDLIDRNGDPLNVTGHTITFIVKRSMATISSIISKVMTQVDPVNGKVKVDITESDTSNLEIRHYFYFITDDSGGPNIETQVRGVFAVNVEWDGWVFDID